MVKIRMHQANLKNWLQSCGYPPWDARVCASYSQTRRNIRLLLLGEAWCVRFTDITVVFIDFLLSFSFTHTHYDCCFLWLPLKMSFAFSVTFHKSLNKISFKLQPVGRGQGSCGVASWILRQEKSFHKSVRLFVRAFFFINGRFTYGSEKLS